MIDAIELGIAETLKVKSNHTKEVKRYKDLKKRFKHRKNKDGLFDLILSKKIREAEKAIITCERTIEGFKAATTLLAGYEFEADEKPDDGKRSSRYRHPFDEVMDEILTKKATAWKDLFDD